MAIDRLYGQGIDATTSDGPPEFAYTVFYDYDANGNVIYIGYALASRAPSGVPGMVAQTVAVPTTGPIAAGAYWAIKRFTYNGSNQVTASQWADGNTQMDNVWNDRAALSYQ